ncbi:hypothetical protein NQZ71_25625 (plasmid) [Niallia taxi]|uniref:hypothetical protein n=1 Tax=Niallia taxi TaxID=2499688 RepID=UPI0029342127|nr:hypothetical protein [Niallia taxi]WOD65272.1 hypothetical protein NQZ71_25625 [Niallia taxi]
MFYSAFTGSTSLGNAAWSIAQMIYREFNVVGDVTALYISILNKFKQISSTLNGDISWNELGLIIGDLSKFLISIVPTARLSDLVTLLWSSSSIL